MAEIEISEPLLYLDQVVALLGIPEREVRELIRDGKLVAVHFSRKQVRILRSDLEACVRDLRSVPAPADPPAR
jgi:excisionase family DNA binding protein